MTRIDWLVRVEHSLANGCYMKRLECLFTMLRSLPVPPISAANQHAPLMIRNKKLKHRLGIAEYSGHLVASYTF